jgi:hypothetical protein
MRLDVSPELRRRGSHVGYTIAILVNAVMLVFTLNIVEWGWFPFLTAEFSEVVPWISLSLIITILANLINLFDDGPSIRSAGQIAINLTGALATLRLWQVFPFDFSGYEFNWEITARIVLILAMVGSLAGLLAEVVKLVSRAIEQKEVT